MSTIVYSISHIACRVLNVVDVNVVANERLPTTDKQRQRERQRQNGRDPFRLAVSNGRILACHLGPTPSIINYYRCHKAKCKSFN